MLDTSWHLDIWGPSMQAEAGVKPTPVVAQTQALGAADDSTVLESFASKSVCWLAAVSRIY